MRVNALAPAVSALSQRAPDDRPTAETIRCAAGVRVLIDTTFALRGPSGTGVYLERLIAALRGLDVDVVEASDPPGARWAAGGGASWTSPPTRAGRRSTCRGWRRWPRPT